MNLKKVPETAGQAETSSAAKKAKFSKKLTYWALGVLIVTILLVTLIPETEESKKNEPSNQNTAGGDKNAEFSVSSSDYINEYSEDKVAAANKYFGRTIMITGTVESWGQTQEDYNKVYLQGKDSYKIACLIRSDQDKKSIKPGMNIKLQGTSHGADNNTLNVVNCKVIDY